MDKLSTKSFYIAFVSKYKPFVHWYSVIHPWSIETA